MSYHEDCSRTLDSNPRKSRPLLVNEKMFRNYKSEKTESARIHRCSCVYTPLLKKHITSLSSLTSLQKFYVMIPHETSWDFRELTPESQSNISVLTSVWRTYFRQTSGHGIARSQEFPHSSLYFRPIDFPVAPSVIGRRQLAVQFLYRRADARQRWPLPSCVDFRTCHYNAFFSTPYFLQWVVRPPCWVLK
jgi:hypothetical protein